MEKIEFSRWLFEGRLRQGKNLLPDGLNWLCYFAGNSKSHHENSISFIFLESPHQVDMKNMVKCQKHFFGYFNALKTQGEKFRSSEVRETSSSHLKTMGREDEKCPFIREVRVLGKLILLNTTKFSSTLPFGCLDPQRNRLRNAWIFDPVFL